MKIILNLFFIFLMGSCSSSQLVEVKGVKRVKLSQDSYDTPQFYVKGFNPKKYKARRSIANHKNNIYENLSLKKLYFLTLWQQHKTYSKLLNIEQDLFCPQFHHDVLVFDKKLHSMEHIFKFDQNYSSVESDPKMVVYYPVMSLPYEGVDLYTYLQSHNRWSQVNMHVKKAVTHFHEKNLKELQSLCMSGASDGLYIFQNLARYYGKDENFINSPKALESILKVKPISNMLILNNLVRSDYQAGWTDVQVALLEKLNVNWFKNYLYEMTSMRNNDLSSYALKE